MESPSEGYFRGDMNPISNWCTTLLLARGKGDMIDDRKKMAESGGSDLSPTLEAQSSKPSRRRDQ
jgi:hypothetical protein